jgi:hypothetical protein
MLQIDIVFAGIEFVFMGCKAASTVKKTTLDAWN